ncbi:MAG: hypothetical protein ACREBI_07070 [Nitrosotalea sp.]
MRANREATRMQNRAAAPKESHIPPSVGWNFFTNKIIQYVDCNVWLSARLVVDRKDHLKSGSAFQTCQLSGNFPNEIYDKQMANKDCQAR